MLKHSYLYSENLIYIINKESKTYDTNKSFNSLIEKVKWTQESFNDGHILLLKGLENFNSKISAQARAYGYGTDVHLYLTANQSGKSFDFHTDSVDVYLHIIYGEKKVFFKKRKKK